ncbi:MAG: hypothetical protein COV76_06440 [Candidatus Omnitrophica bacterium CG11_big_fil_rev_8_21_14_0_20_64_10]|nr:MAG: hypothetical protein COV76_06440 [Candidatus Omnitrophica bacterium CG11_big_fil_rev_8_21_14_0_20_64_10]
MTIWEQLHPMTVHFPIAFLLVGWLAEPLAVWLKVPRLGPFGFWCGVVGAFSLLGAVITGGISSTALRSLPAGARWMLDAHGFWGGLAFVTAAISCGWRMALGSEVGPFTRWGSWTLLGIACGFMVVSAHLGGMLVYEMKLPAAGR